MMRVLTICEVDRLVAARRWPTLIVRLAEHLQACGDALPTVLDGLTRAERDQLSDVLLAAAGDNDVIH